MCVCVFVCVCRGGVGVCEIYIYIYREREREREREKAEQLVHNHVYLHLFQATISGFKKIINGKYFADHVSLCTLRVNLL